MPDQKISVDPVATDLIAAIIPIVQGGVNKQAASSLFVGGGGTWGTITGTLSSQTDLQTALDGKWSLLSGGALTGNNTISGAFTVDFQNSIFNRSTGNITFSETIANSTSKTLIKSNKSGTSSNDFAMRISRTDTNTISNEVAKWGFNQDRVFDAASHGVGLKLENRYAPSAPSDNWQEFHYEVELPNSTSTRLFSSTFRQGATLAASFNQWDFRGESISLSTVDSLLNWCTISIGAIQLYSTTGGHGIGISVNSVTSIAAIAPVTGTFTGGFDLENFPLLILPGIHITTSDINFRAATDINTIRINTSTLPLQLVSQAGLVVSGSSGEQKIASGASSGAVRAYYSVNVGTGEARLWCQTGGYFQTIYANAAERMRFSALGNILIGSTTDNARLYAVQSALASTWIPAFRVDPGAHTSMTAGTAFPNQVFASATQSWVAVAGTIAAQKDTEFRAITHSAATSGTFTDLYNVFMGAPLVGGLATATRRFALGLADALQFTIGTTVASNLANTISLSAKDSSDGAANATLALYCEQAVEAIGTFTESHKLKIWVNNVEYWVSLDAV